MISSTEVNTGRGASDALTALRKPARAAGADLLLTLGGGSVTDAAKMVAFCLGNGVTDRAQLDDYRARVSADGKIVRPQTKPPAVRTVTIPTTLSAGEYTASAGCTDTARNVKESFGHPMMKIGRAS